MKPKINLNDPMIKSIIDFLEFDYKYDTLKYNRVENATIPIFHIYLNKKKPVQIGSGVIIKIMNEFFIFSASHVFDDIGDKAILIGLGNETPLFCLAGDRFSTARDALLKHQADPLDASVYHIQSNINDEIKKIALDITEIDFPHVHYSNDFYYISGFRSSKQKFSKSSTTTKRDLFMTREFRRPEYDLLNIDSNYHIGLCYEKQILVNGIWQMSPKPKGMSGGSIIRRVDSDLLKIREYNKEKKVLSGIIIEHIKGVNNKPPVLKGIRIGIFLHLINMFLPDFLSDDIINKLNYKGNIINY